MYEIIFFKNKNYKNDFEAYLHLLSEQKATNKSSKIKFKKIIAYLDLLEKKGLELGQPYIKHISDEIWELRPLRDRIFFACLNNNKIIILHYFMKQTQKTPLREIEKAKNNLKIYKNGGGIYG